MVGRYKVGGGGGGSLLEGGILLVVGRGLPLQSPHPPMPPVGKYLVWQGGESTFGGIKICWWWGESTWGRIFLGVGGMNKFSAGGGDSLFHSPSPHYRKSWIFIMQTIVCTTSFLLKGVEPPTRFSKRRGAWQDLSF